MLKASRLSWLVVALGCLGLSGAKNDWVEFPATDGRTHFGLIAPSGGWEGSEGETNGSTSGELGDAVGGSGTGGLMGVLSGGGNGTASGGAGVDLSASGGSGGGAAWFGGDGGGSPGSGGSGGGAASFGGAEGGLAGSGGSGGGLAGSNGSRGEEVGFEGAGGDSAGIGGTDSDSQKSGGDQGEGGGGGSDSSSGDDESSDNGNSDESSGPDEENESGSSGVSGSGNPGAFGLSLRNIFKVISNSSLADSLGWLTEYLKSFDITIDTDTDEISKVISIPQKAVYRLIQDVIHRLLRITLLKKIVGNTGIGSSLLNAGNKTATCLIDSSRDLPGKVEKRMVGCPAGIVKEVINAVSSVVRDFRLVVIIMGEAYTKLVHCDGVQCRIGGIADIGKKAGNLVYNIVLTIGRALEVVSTPAQLPACFARGIATEVVEEAIRFVTDTIHCITS